MDYIKKLVHQTLVWVKNTVIYSACLTKEMRDGKQRTVSVPAWGKRAMDGGTGRSGYGAATS